ncbi:MAG: hypothetical protein IPK16_33730 [Anaerolineales bacterium]|nr:hypothetical protein [Anaerolineales bacterium]
MRSPRPSPRRDLTAEILTISVVVALFVLFGVAMLWLLDQSGYRFAPTPTPTATPRPSTTPTPDVMATQNVEDMLTQVAFAATVVFQLTPGQYPTDLPYAEQATTIANLPVVIVPNLTPTPNPVAPPAPPEFVTPAPVSTAVYMPVVTNPESTPTPVAPTPMPLTPEPFATWTATPITPLPMTPSPTPFVPTPTATFQVVQPTATSTPAPFGDYYATVNRSGSTAIYPGPSNGYSALGSISQGGSMRVFGRTGTGDWLYGCCVPNSSSSQNFWIRRAYVTISPPAGADAEDLRPLPVTTVEPSLGARPTPTAIPLGDFPLARFDSANSGRVPNLPGTDLRYVWPISPQGAEHLERSAICWRWRRRRRAPHCVAPPEPQRTPGIQLAGIADLSAGDCPGDGVCRRQPGVGCGCEYVQCCGAGSGLDGA